MFSLGFIIWFCIKLFYRFFHFFAKLTFKHSCKQILIIKLKMTMVTQSNISKIWQLFTKLTDQKSDNGTLKLEKICFHFSCFRDRINFRKNSFNCYRCCYCCNIWHENFDGRFFDVLKITSLFNIFCPKNHWLITEISFLVIQNLQGNYFKRKQALKKIGPRALNLKF